MNMMMMKDEKEMKEEVEMETYIIFVADAADIVRGAKIAPHEIFHRSSGTKLLHMTIIHAPHDKTTCHVE